MNELRFPDDVPKCICGERLGSLHEPLGERAEQDIRTVCRGFARRRKHDELCNGYRRGRRPEKRGNLLPVRGELP